MPVKHFINDPVHLVNSALYAVTLTNPNVALDAENKIVYLRPKLQQQKQQRVSIISGGGSGHEPSFASMVGPGLLSAAVAGTIFASPSTEQVRTAITSRVDHHQAEGSGVLVTVMNYTGDILNFGVAVEKARAATSSSSSSGNIDMVVVADDVGVGRAKGGKVGRRGIAGTVLVHKISGALAARDFSLSEVAKVARLVASNLVSVGASLDHVHVPGRAVEGSSEKSLAIGEVEIGMGIHNEPGSGRERLELPALVGRMLSQLLDQSDGDRAFLKIDRGAETVLLVNNLGGVSALEMGGITAEVVAQLAAAPWEIKPVRILSGTYMTSLNGLGFSITLLRVADTGIDGIGLVDLLDDPCEATGWSAAISKESWESKVTTMREERAGEVVDLQPSGLKMLDAGQAQDALVSALGAVIAAEPDVTRFDTIVGDGDCGIGLKRGAEAVLKHISEKPLSGDAAVDLAEIVPVVETTMDGTSGALYAIFLNSLVRSLRDLSPGEASPKVWAEALRRSRDALSKYTPARPGDRTLMDALYPFIEVLAETRDLKKATAAARQGAESTKGMKASLGRTVYVGGSGFEQVPDPGAWGLACFFSGLAGTTG